MKPTYVQMRVLCYVAAHFDVTGEGPVFREIADYLHLPYVTTPQWHLRQLQRMGLVEWQAGLRRSIRVTAAGRAALGLTGDNRMNTTRLWRSSVCEKTERIDPMQNDYDEYKVGDSEPCICGDERCVATVEDTEKEPSRVA